ncbi:MAG: hypothetical protein RR337_12590 [Clostridia bacterium]
MPSLLIVLSILAVLLASRVLARKITARNACAAVRAQWGHAPSESLDAESLLDVARYWREKQAAHLDACSVDDITWNDLGMDAVFQKLNHTHASVGAEALYAMLRDVGTPDTALALRGKWIAWLAAHTPAREQAQGALHALGRTRFHGAYPYLFNPQYRAPRRAYPFFVLAALPLVLTALGFIWPACFFMLPISFLVNALVYYRTHTLWKSEQSAIRHLAAVLHCANRLSTLKLPGMADWLDEVRPLCALLKPIARWNALYAMQRTSEMDFLTDYLRIMLQLDMISLTRLSRFLSGHAQAVARLYALVGELDACCAVASVRTANPQCVAPEFCASRTVTAVGLAHPLVRKPVKNDLIWSQNALITGSNASGKSTFIKAMAVNAILAQSVLTCWADKFVMPRAQVMSSMALRDDLASGESYFIVEVRSLRRIVGAIGSALPTLVFVDEILRGTNTVERIATSAALLNYLCGLNALLMAATHDIELTYLTPGYLQRHFREEMTEAGMTFPYKLMDGPCTTRNAIKLLDVMAFPSAVIQQARALAERFDQSGQWR